MSEKLDHMKDQKEKAEQKLRYYQHPENQLRAERRTNTVHFHHGIKFGKLPRKTKHLLLECSH